MLTGLEVMFMGVTKSYSGLFSTPGFLVSPVGKRGRGAKKKRREGGKKGIEKVRKEGRRNNKKKEGQKGRRNLGGKEERKKYFLLALNLSG